MVAPSGGFTVVLQPRWLAPEAMIVIQTEGVKDQHAVKYKGEFLLESDVYSFGIMMWEIATQRMPFDPLDNPDWNWACKVADFIQQGGRPEMKNDERQKITVHQYASQMSQTSQLQCSLQWQSR